MGVLSGSFGVGGGFNMVPAMIQLPGMPTETVIGTSLYRITFLAAFTTRMQVIGNRTLDFGRAPVLPVGGVVGAQFGARPGQKFNADVVRLLLAALVLLVSVKIAFDLALPPRDAFSIMPR